MSENDEIIKQNNIDEQSSLIDSSDKDEMNYDRQKQKQKQKQIRLVSGGGGPRYYCIVPPQRLKNALGPEVKISNKALLLLNTTVEYVLTVLTTLAEESVQSSHKKTVHTSDIFKAIDEASIIKDTLFKDVVPHSFFVTPSESHIPPSIKEERTRRRNERKERKQKGENIRKRKIIVPNSRKTSRNKAATSKKKPISKTNRRNNVSMKINRRNKVATTARNRKLKKNKVGLKSKSDKKRYKKNAAKRIPKPKPNQKIKLK